MLKVIQHIYMIPLITSTLLSIRAYRRHWPAPFRVFSILLMCLLFVESSAILWKYLLFSFAGQSFSRSNLWLYNSFLLPQYLLYLTVYYLLIKSRRIKKAILYSGVGYTLFCFISWTFLQSIYEVDSINLAVASGLVIFVVIAYFEEIKRRENHQQAFSQQANWISLGALIFHAANIPYLLCLNYLVQSDFSLAVTFFYVYMALNCIMYTLYSIAFLCKHTLHK